MLTTIRVNIATLYNMKLATIIFSAKLWLTIMLCITMSFSVFAADIHPADANGNSCQNADITVQYTGLAIAGETDNDREEGPAHEHHAHSCGSCHFHVVGNKLANLSVVAPSSLTLRFLTDHATLHAGPLGLYRPPRA